MIRTLVSHDVVMVLYLSVVKLSVFSQVTVIGDGDFSERDFTWVSGLVDTAVDFSNDKFTLLNGGKSLKVNFMSSENFKVAISMLSSLFFDLKKSNL